MTRRELLKNSGAVILWAGCAADLNAQDPSPSIPSITPILPSPSSIPGNYSGFPIEASSPTLFPAGPAFTSDPNWGTGSIGGSIEFPGSDPSSTRILESPGESLYATSPGFDVFVFRAFEVGLPGPLRPGGEVAPVAGYSSRDGVYGGVILATGGEVGGDANYVGKFGGVEVTASAQTLHSGDILRSEPITFNFASVGAEIPDIAGLGISYGRYFSGAGETGRFLELHIHLLGFKTSGGIGGSYDPVPWGPGAACRVP